jgi:hypothetical protein
MGQALLCSEMSEAMLDITMLTAESRYPEVPTGCLLGRI